MLPLINDVSPIAALLPADICDILCWWCCPIPVLLLIPWLLWTIIV